jgi:hypothetical protein
MLEAAFFPKSRPINLDFLSFVLHFMLDPGTNPVPEPKPVPVRQKSAVPAVSVPQHCKT